MDGPAFFEELKRRHVYKVAAVYAVVAWVVIQIAATALPYLLDRPDTLIRIVIILSLVGFPVALVLGWVFDVTPQGVQRTDARAAAPVSGGGHKAQPNRARLVAVGSLLVAAVAVGFALWYVRENTTSAPNVSFGSLGDQIQQRMRQELQGVDRSPQAARGTRMSDMPAGFDMDSVLREAGAALGNLSEVGWLEARGPLPARLNRIAVFPFDVPGAADGSGWQTAMADSLNAALAAAGFRTVDAASIRKAMDEAGTEPEDRATKGAIARGLGADAFITGAVVSRTETVLVNVLLSDVDAPDSVRHATAIMPANRFRGGLTRLVSRLTRTGAAPAP